jgi:hypothetical protein
MIFRSLTFTLGTRRSALQHCDSDIACDILLGMTAQNVAKLPIAVWALVASWSCASTTRAAESQTLPIALCAPHFLAGDSISIDAVQGPRADFEAGKEYVVSGRYVLSSQDEATLAFYMTNGEVSRGSSMRVTKGSGDYAITFVVERVGMPHVSYYPLPAGTSFGGVWFGVRECKDARAGWDPAHGVP